MKRPRCPLCGGMDIHTAEWCKWTAAGPRPVQFVDSAVGCKDYCENCDEEVAADWIEVPSAN